MYYCSAQNVQKADIKAMCQVSNISGESRLLKNLIEASRVYYLQLQVIVIDAKVRFKVTLHSKSTFYSISYQVLHKSQCYFVNQVSHIQLGTQSN